MIVSILICGYFTIGATNDTQVRLTPNASIPANVTPVPTAISSATALPAPPIINASTVTPTPIPANNSNTVHSDFAPGLPPAVHFTHVPAYGSTDTVKGIVTGIDDPENYKLAVFINYYGWYNVPSSTQRLTNISSDGSWECNITRGGFGRNATEIDAFLVPADFVPTKVSGRYGLPADLKGNATAVNGVTRKPPVASS